MSDTEIRPAETPSPLAARITAAMKALLVLVAAVYLVNFAAAGIEKIRTPFFERDERWQGVHLIAAVRLLEGKALYPDYETEGGYYAYTPFVPVVQAAAIKVFGANLETLKALTFVVTLVCLAGAVLIAFELTRSFAAAFVAAAVFAGTYRFLIEWHFDIRPDPFAAALCLWGAFIASRWLRAGKGWAGNVAASALFALAALSKQNFLLAPVAYVGFVAVVRGRRAAFAAFAPAALLIGGALVYFDIGGEHMYETIAVMAREQMKSGQGMLEFFTVELVAITLPLFLSAAGVVMLIKAGGPAESRALYIVMYFASFVLGLVPVLKEAGSVNSLLFFCATMGVFAVVGVWGAGRRAVMRPQPVMLVGALIFLAIETAASFSFWESQPYEAFVQPAYNFAVRHKAERVYFPRSNYVTYLASGQYYPDDNMDWDRELLCGAGVPKNIIDMLQRRYWDYIIGEFYSGKLNAVRELYYQPMPVPAGTYTVYERRIRPVAADAVEE